MTSKRTNRFGVVNNSWTKEDIGSHLELMVTRKAHCPAMQDTQDWVQMTLVP